MNSTDFFSISVDIDESSVMESKETTANQKQCQKMRVHDGKLRRGGYRPVLIDESKLKTESQEINAALNKISTLKDEMSSPDIVAYYIITYLNQRYPKQLFESVQPIFDATSQAKTRSITNSRTFVDLIEFKNKNATKKLLKMNMTSLFDLVNNFNLHSVPYSARFTLVNWYLENKFNLVLFLNSIPSSEDVLRMQSRSERCVSLIFDKIDSLIMNERDPLSFLLHDLVHAFKMFSNDYLLAGQVGFSRAILSIFHDATARQMLQQLLENNSSFSDNFNYLISDMNSHPKHLFFYFKSILINAFKEKHNIKETTMLQEEPLDDFNRTFETFVDVMNMNECEKTAARKMLMNIQYDDLTNKKIDKTDFSVLDEYFLQRNQTVCQ